MGELGRPNMGELGRSAMGELGRSPMGENGTRTKIQYTVAIQKNLGDPLWENMGAEQSFAV